METIHTNSVFSTTRHLCVQDISARADLDISKVSAAGTKYSKFTGIVNSGKTVATMGLVD